MAAETPSDGSSGAVLVAADELRARFAAAMSAMYRAEVSAYGTLLQIVAKVNAQMLAADPAQQAGELQRLSVERHGAIRVGTAAELATLRRVFAVLGMYPVGYYDLAPAGMPVHSTAFRPLQRDALRQNPFRVFTSLLRPELISDAGLCAQAEQILQQRRIFTAPALSLLEIAEEQGGLTPTQADTFISEILHTFRWQAKAQVSHGTYQHLHHAHRLLADIVSFRGPHINHLTPRVLDIDRAQALMPECGIEPKAVIEGPPRRQCPILLRQTSFKALTEAVYFPGEPETGSGETGISGQHTARFGEIEQRGVALTPKGRDLYDRLLSAIRHEITPAADGSNAAEYLAALQQGFAAFPDDWRTLLDQELAYFTFSLTQAGEQACRTHPAVLDDFSLKHMMDKGLLRFEPITYEDFLPVSAAGIFQSNLGDQAVARLDSQAGQQQFEAALGTTVTDAFNGYAQQQYDSLQACIQQLQQGADN